MQSRGPDAAKEIFIHSVLESLRRRKYLILTPILIFAAIAIFYTSRLVPVYRSEALLRAEPMATVGDFVDATGVPHATHVLNIDENFRNIQEIVLGETVLTEVTKEFRLTDLVNGRVPEAELQDLKKRVSIRMDGGESRNSEPQYVSFWVGFEGNNPSQITGIANRLAELFMKEASKAREQRVSEIVGFIQAEMEPLQKTLDKQIEKIRQYRQGSPDSLPEQATANLRILEGLQTQYLAKTDSISKDEARRAAIVEELHELEKQGALETITPVVERSEMEKKLDDLRNQLRQMQARYAPDYPELKRVQKEISEVEPMVPQPSNNPRVERSPFYLLYIQRKSELLELDQRAQSYGKELKDLTRQMAAYRSRVEVAPIRESELAVMSRDYSATQVQYQQMLEKQHNAQLAAHFEKLGSEIIFRVIDPARIPSQPIGSQHRRIILLGLLGGLGLGIVLAFFAEQMDSSFGSVADYQRACDIPLLAIVPTIPRCRSTRRHPNGIQATPLIVTLRDPQSIPAEQYRILAMKAQAGNTGPSRTIVITSAAGGEGKTLTAINLAVALSVSPDRKVLLIDADLRRPRVHEFIGQGHRPEKGFADLLSEPGDVDPDSYIRQIEDLFYIPGVTRRTNILSLLTSQRVRDVLQKLRTRFQFIVLDAPPILPIADSLILSSLADDVYLVVRAGKTPRELFQHAVETLDAVNIRGVVLNHVDFQDSRYAHAYRYYRKNYLAQQPK